MPKERFNTRITRYVGFVLQKKLPPNLRDSLF